MDRSGTRFSNLTHLLFVISRLFISILFFAAKVIPFDLDNHSGMAEKVQVRLLNGTTTERTMLEVFHHIGPACADCEECNEDSLLHKAVEAVAPPTSDKVKREEQVNPVVQEIKKVQAVLGHPILQYLPIFHTINTVLINPLLDGVIKNAG